MLTAYQFTAQKQVIAQQVLKHQGPYFCPVCGEELTLRKGLIRIHHFAHQGQSNCVYKGETQEHMQIKTSIFQALQKEYAGRVKRIGLEVPLGPVRPDVYLEGRKKKIAIEVQQSSLPVSDLLKRTYHYHQLNVHVLWVLPFAADRLLEGNSFRDASDCIPIRLKAYERAIAAMYYRNLILWDRSKKYSNGFIILQLEDSWIEGSQFYSIDWSAMIKFDPKKHKSYRRIGRVALHIKLNDFVPTTARPYQVKGTKYILPQRKVLFFDWDKQALI